MSEQAIAMQRAHPNLGSGLTCLLADVPNLMNWGLLRVSLQMFSASMSAGYISVGHMIHHICVVGGTEYVVRLGRKNSFVTDWGPPAYITAKVLVCDILTGVNSVPNNCEHYNDQQDHLAANF